MLDQQLAGTEDEHDTHQQQQDDREIVHELLEAGPEKVTDDVGHAFAIGADRQQSGEIVVNRAGEDGADDDPDEGRGPIESAENRTEDRAETRDVENLDEENLGRRHTNVVDTVIHALGRDRAARIGTENAVDNCPIDEIAGNQ